MRYDGKEFQSLNGAGFNANYYDVATDDVRDECWSLIRGRHATA